jgi:DUF1680 family protein
MAPRTVVANSKVAADQGRVAVERGPLVYCAETADNKDGVLHVVINQYPTFATDSDYSIKNTEGDGRVFTVTSLTTSAQSLSVGTDGKVDTRDIQLRLIPYYAWNHRGANEMEVWFAQGVNVLTVQK